MDKTQEVLSEIVVYNKYAKYLPSESRRETWEEITNRYLNTMIKKFPKLKSEILEKGKLIHSKKLLMSMRAAQFGGVAIERNNARVFNCSFLPMDSYQCFSETMFLLLTGCGVGYSVQQHHIEKMPEIVKPIKTKKYLVADNIEGWADAIKQLMKAYLGITKYKPVFDLNDIREKGELLITSGGKAPGPEPLRLCLVQVEAILSNKKDGEKLTSLEIHDIQCYIADCVLSGGVRRAAMLALFSMEDEDMLTCKFGNWWESNPQRGRANNSVVAVRSRLKEEDFKAVWEMVEKSGSGEPGISLTDNQDWGFNPCHEIALRPYTFCNLVEINGGAVDSEQDFYETCKVAAFFGTLQASFTDFHYLRPIWKRNTDKDALVGVGITGIANGNLIELKNKAGGILATGAKIIKAVNEEWATIIGINKAARTTTIKPAGTTSIVLGTSSGIHAWHAKKYIRNMQCAVGSDLYNYFKSNHPLLIEHMVYQPNTAVIGIPQIAPEKGVLREDETALRLLERIKTYNLEWVREGHRSGSNFNNVSATVSIKPDEWKDVGDWMWENRNTFSGLSVLPYDGGTYKNAPFEEVSEEVFNEKLRYIENVNIDLTQIIELVDNTKISDTVACSGGSCELI